MTTLKRDWPKAQPAPGNIKGFMVSDLSYCDPEVRDANCVIIDTSLQPQPEKLVLVVTHGKPAVKRFKDISEDDYVVGMVIEVNWSLRKA